MYISRRVCFRLDRLCLPLCFVAGVLVFGSLAHGNEERGDFWLDASLGFRVAAEPHDKFSAQPDPAVASDYVKKSVGDCSVVAKLGAAGESPVVVLVPGPYRASWSLGGNWSLQLDLAAEGGAAGTHYAFSFIDTSGRVARSSAQGLQAGNGWMSVRVSFGGLERPADFDFSQVARVALVFSDGGPERVWLDAVRFAGPDREIALTDQLTTQRMADEIATRPARIDEAFQVMASMKADESPQGFFYYAVPNRDANEPNLQRLFANLQLNRKVEQTNRELLSIYTSTDKKQRADYGLEYTWDLLATPTLCRFYLNFGSKSLRYPGRLSPEVEKAILDLLWERTQFKNDFHFASQSTWNLTGSENHDINAKIANVISSLIFMREPAFADRLYPNLGSGLGYGYWFHKTKLVGRFHGPEGTAPPDYPGDFRPADHYLAWVTFMKTYLRERAGRGFFLEKASPTYMRYTVSFLQDLYDYCDDAELKQMTGMFLDLVWAEWAQDQIAGARGGARTRDHGPLVDFRQDAMYQMATFFFGGPSRFSAPLSSFWLTDYRPPAVVWNLVLNREALGSFAYISRTPGEEAGMSPRPAGMERTLMTDSESRLLRYSWVTPDYILGTQMDHPLAVHSHLSPAGRGQGMTFATGPDAMVFPRDIIVQADGSWKIGKDAMYRSVQEGPVLITQQSRDYLAVSPEWFPSPNHDSRPFGIYFSKGLDRVEEQDGWVFVEEGNAYLAVRVVGGVYQVSVDAQSATLEWLEYQASEEPREPIAPRPYAWSPDRTLLRCEDRHSPIIFEAGRRAEYPGLDDFKRHILGNPVRLNKTTVPGWYTMEYKSNGVEYYFNASNSEISRIDGRPVDYAPARTFDSPYIRADYRSSLVAINDGHKQLVLDFVRGQREEKSIP